LTVRLPLGAGEASSLGRLNANIAQYRGGMWKDAGQASAGIDSDLISVADSIGAEGFYRLRFAAEVPESGQFDIEAYAVVSADWKRDILAFCRELKEQIETSPDAKLIFSSIAVSHFDHVMDLASEGAFLSGRMLEALVCAIESKRKFEAGACPDLVVGLNKLRLKRFEGAETVEFVVFVPENYHDSRKWPVLLNPDPRRRESGTGYTERSDLIDVWWHFSGYEGYEWKNYQYFLNILRSKLSLDEDRVYLYGLCGNGIAATALALNYPDQWAECASVLGNACRNLAGNALNLSLVFVRGGHSQEQLICYYNFAAKCFLYQGCRYFRHSIREDVSIDVLRGSPTPNVTRVKSPKRVLFSVDSSKAFGAYWATINGREDENLTGTIDACVNGQAIDVKTTNVCAYSLDLVRAPVDSNRPVEIIENGTSLGSVRGNIFVEEPLAYAKATYVKNKPLQGPVWDAFTDPYAVVWPSSSRDQEFCSISAQVAKSLANGAPCFSDINMPESLIDTHNLILLGTAASNKWLSRICGKLPVEIEHGRITADGRRYEGRDMGLILIYPNPLNPKRYVVALWATSAAAMRRSPAVWKEMKSMPPVDVAVFEVTKKGDVRWHIFERFSSTWDWHDHWSESLGAVFKKHPKWQWSRWAARAVRKQLGADVVVYEEPFRFPDSLGTGEITYRDLFNSFRNDWIVKVRLDGKGLRSLLTASYMDTSWEGVAAVLDGVSLVGVEQKDSQDDRLAIGDIEDNKKYTVAFPERIVSRLRTGMDYVIVGEAYLVPLLKNYLLRSEGSDVDAELDSFKLTIF
jgi:pimeloyl-ACP methyl ester carboxylesterase